MTMTLYSMSASGRIGEMVVDDQGQPVSSTDPAMAELVSTAEAGGFTAKDLDGWFNGYVYITSDPNASFPEVS